jgi:RNAse H-fold protein YqgF
MKILAIDPGSKRIGLAASDELQLTTRLLPVLTVSGKQVLPALIELIAREGFQKILVGLPLNMDGSEGPAAKQAKRLASDLEAQLRARELPAQIELWDERLTSFAADERIRERGIPKAKAKGFLDSLAAEVLLEDYLRSKPG